MTAPVRREGPVAVLDSALPVEEIERLWSYATARVDEFVPTRVLAHAEGASPLVDPDVRRNLHLSGIQCVPESVLREIQCRIPELASALDDSASSDLRGGTYEAEITATCDGGFFAPHVDDGNLVTSDRSISFVLFFSKMPRPFRGGELCVETDWRHGDRLFVYDAEQDGLLGPDGVAVSIQPEPNRLVVFRSRRVHEIRPVSVESRQFGDARFTVTGFVRN